MILWSTEFVLSAALLLPFIGALLIGVIGQCYHNLREFAGVVTAAALLVLMMEIHRRLMFASIPLEFTWVELFPAISLTFKVEALGMIFALIASVLWLVSIFYSMGYMRGNREAHQTRFFVCFTLAIGAAVGIAFSGNLLTLFVFYELMTLVTYPLVTHKQSKESRESGRIYLGLLLAGSLLFLLPAILWTYHATGTLDFVEGGILTDKVDGAALGFLLALFMFGIGKAALMPMHYWLPAAMVAPTPVSALLHAVAVVKAGVFCVVKIIVYVFGVEFLQEAIAIDWWSGGWLVYIAGFTIITASLVALRQDNLKLRLAYSTVSQLSYIIMATALLATKSLVAAAFHIAAHAFGKITLFFAAGSIYTASKKKMVSELDGIGRAMPITMIAFSIGALSMIGVPPAVGFITKWYIFEGAFNMQHYFVVGVLVLSTILNAMYFLPIIHKAFFNKRRGKELMYKEAPVPILLAISTTAIGTLGLFFYPEFFLNLAMLVEGIR